MTAPKPLLPPCPPRTVRAKYARGDFLPIDVIDADYADWWQYVARRAMEYARHGNHCCYYSIAHYKALQPPCDCGLTELRAAISKAIEVAK